MRHIQQGGFFKDGVPQRGKSLERLTVSLSVAFMRLQNEPETLSFTAELIEGQTGFETNKRTNEQTSL